MPLNSSFPTGPTAIAVLSLPSTATLTASVSFFSKLVIRNSYVPFLTLPPFFSGEDIRDRYYLHEANNRRANGTAKDDGKANRYFTGDAVTVAK